MPKERKATTRKAIRKKRVLRKRVFFIFVPLVILLLIAAYGGYLYWKAHSVLSDAHENDQEKSALRDQLVDPKVDNVSVLIIGIDSSEKRGADENGLSDTLMLATFNKKENSVKLLSIPRDSLVYIPDLGYETKINAAHSHGGPRGTVNTVENLLDVPIDYWVRVNFEAFIEVVEAVGGVEVDVPYEFTEQDSKDVPNAIHLMPGRQKLNGEEALAFARTRKIDNDIERGKRQQEIIKAIVHESASVKSVLKAGELIDAVGTNMKTNMRFSEMKSFLSYGLNSKGLQIDTLTLDGTDYQPGNTYYWLLNEESLEETKKELQEHLR